MSSPEQIQQEIERTRSELSNNVDRLTDKVSPSRVMHRRVDSVKSSVTSVKDRVMGGAADSTHAVSGTASDAVSRVGDVASNAPQNVRRQAQGNPLAAGVIAFGVGWLLSSLAPASEAERHLAEQAEAKAKQAAEPLKSVGQDVAQNLKEPVQQGIEQVKNTATDAAQTTTDQAKSSAQDVKEQATP